MACNDYCLHTAAQLEFIEDFEWEEREQIEPKPNGNFSYVIKNRFIQ
jgi:hypothetical protein